MQKSQQETNKHTETRPVICKRIRSQLCPICKTPMGDMPGSRDAYCPNCGFKDPCCE